MMCERNKVSEPFSPSLASCLLQAVGCKAQRLVGFFADVLSKLANEAPPAALRSSSLLAV